ncbi:response regulator [Jiangella asiatica]|uniref:Response regulator transcription factor n=1 Tax=Jiangella asiatica TaxID=2530372 RepID=A0A4R5C8W1_9ACTN|nr:response regulator transcription factor [Jiangella asiatica]TDD94610.1 response regulator transcription factor [Jiangella asiatica]
MAGSAQSPRAQAPPVVVGVMVVDDQQPFLTVARFVVGSTPGFQVVGEATSGEDALEQAAALRPDLVLMDIHLPGMSGIEATRRLVANAPGTAVVLMSTYPAADLPRDARTCGARAYVNKEDLTPDVLVAVMSGEQPPGF